MKAVLESDAIQEKALAAAVLSDAAGKASAVIDSFASWLLAGFGAGVALLLSNHDVQSLTPTRTVRMCLLALAGAVVLVVAEKCLSIAVTGSAEAGKNGRDLMDRTLANLHLAGVDRPQRDPRIIVNEAKRALFWPGYSLISGSLEKVLAGDLASWSRVLTRMAQIQGILVLGEIVLFLTCVFRIAATLSP